MEAAGNVGAAGEFGEACFCAPAGPAEGLTEMTCVYGLGPLGGAGWAGMGSLAGRLNAFVAPAEAEGVGATTGGFSIARFGSGRVGKIGGVGTEAIGVGTTYDAGCGGTKGSFAGAGKTDASSITDRCNSLGGAAAAVPDVRDTIFGVLNHPVNPAPGGSLPAAPAAGKGSSGRGGLNIAVKSPTVFRGGSICCGDMAGISDGPSTRNGP
jgi:hypothetical protein